MIEPHVTPKKIPLSLRARQILWQERKRLAASLKGRSDPERRVFLAHAGLLLEAEALRLTGFPSLLVFFACLDHRQRGAKFRQLRSLLRDVLARVPGTLDASQQVSLYEAALRLSRQGIDPRPFLELALDGSLSGPDFPELIRLIEPLFKGEHQVRPLASGGEQQLGAAIRKR